jgi:ferritin-like metal-binding protein YciE
LAEAFQEGRLTTDPTLDELLKSDSDAVQAYKMLQALVKLARNQILLESQLQTHTVQLADHDERLENIESTLGDTGRLVTPDQASQISQAVKTVAIALGKKSGRNEFGAIYGELYRKFGITGYKMLPARQFEAAMRFLTEWYQELTGEGLPF